MTPLQNPHAVRERVGLLAAAATPNAIIDQIIAAETAGVRQVWMTQPPTRYETLGIFAAAATQTRTVRLGTAIVPTYPRHPLVMAQEALLVHDLSGGRLRLGIGPSHRPTIEGVYGLAMVKPLAHLREYLTILRGALWDGHVDVAGAFYTVHLAQAPIAQIPLLVSALGEQAFRLAGTLADGAISWMCPASYVLETALPALRQGANDAKRTPPPLIAHVPVALSTDRQAVLAAARAQLGTYGHLPFYQQMFAGAGFPVTDTGALSDELLDTLVVSGDEATISARIQQLLAQGCDEVLLAPVTIAALDVELAGIRRVIGNLPD